MEIVDSFEVTSPSPIVEKGNTPKKCLQGMWHFTQSLHVHAGSPESKVHNVDFCTALYHQLAIVSSFTIELVNLLLEVCL